MFFVGSFDEYITKDPKIWAGDAVFATAPDGDMIVQYADERIETTDNDDTSETHLV